ncbi:MAG: SDR family oxidoreductase [Enhygromyxa sp.]
MTPVKPDSGARYPGIALITGGTRGIGRAISMRLAADAPAHLILAYNRNHDAARASAAMLRERGVACTTVPCELGREDEIERLFALIAERFGRLDLFVSNAARASFRPARSMSLRAWQRTMDINARAFLHGSQLAAKLMTSGGAIVGLSSLGSRGWAPGYVALGAAKAALESTARYLAVELAPLGINVNVLCGGLIDSETLSDAPELAGYVAAARRRCPAGRLGRPEDLAEIVAFLASPAAGWIRGQTIVADGGLSLVS